MKFGTRTFLLLFNTFIIFESHLTGVTGYLNLHHYFNNERSEHSKLPQYLLNVRCFRIKYTAIYFEFITEIIFLTKWTSIKNTYMLLSNYWQITRLYCLNKKVLVQHFNFFKIFINRRCKNPPKNIKSGQVNMEQPLNQSK